ELEERYAAFNGLNLCFETREGILKHCSVKHARELGEVGRRFIERTQPSLEAQIANLADEIAYNNHDVDDGLRSGLIRIEQLMQIEIFATHHAAVMRKYPNLERQRAIAETIRAMINTLIVDLTETTLANIRRVRPGSTDDVRASEPLAAFSAPMRAQADALKRFLLNNLYRHSQVMRMTTKARRIVRELIVAFINEPRLLKDESRRDDHLEKALAIADYIAGMTDRYAIREHRELFRMD